MSYIYSGYAVALVVLGGHTGLLWRRKSKLERLADQRRKQQL